MERDYLSSKWDFQSGGSSSQHKSGRKAVNRTVPTNMEEAFYNNTSAQARREKLSEAYGRTLLSALQTSHPQPSSPPTSSTSEPIPPPSDDERRSNPFPIDFGRKRDEQSETEAPKLCGLAHGSIVPQMPVHVGSSSPVSHVTSLNADAIRQQIMLAGINALSMNNPSLQAQLLLGLNNSANLDNPLINLNSLPILEGSIKSSVPDGSGLLKYRAPDMDSFVLDQKAGYKFDSSTGLHYDANSGLFINLAQRIFLRWNPLLNTYLRVDLPALGQPLGMGVVPRSSGLAVSQSTGPALPLMNTNPNILNTGLNVSAGLLPTETKLTEASSVLLGDQLSNAVSCSTAQSAVQDSFMSEIWQRMRALAQEAICESQSTSKNSKVHGKSPNLHESEGHRRRSSRSRYSPLEDKSTSRSRSRSLDKRSTKRSKGKKQSKRSRSSDARSCSRGRKMRTHSRSPGLHRRRSSSTEEERSSSRGRISNSRGLIRSTSRSLGHSRGSRRNLSRSVTRSHSREKRSSSRRPRRSNSRSPGHSRGTRRISRGRRRNSRGLEKSTSRSPVLSRGARRSSRGRRCNSRGLEKGTSLSPISSRGDRRSRSRSVKRSHSRGRRSSDRGTKSLSKRKRRSCSRGTGIRHSKDVRRGHSRQRRSRIQEARRIHTRDRTRSISCSPDHHTKPSLKREAKARNRRSHSVSPKRQHLSSTDGHLKDASSTKRNDHDHKRRKGPAHDNEENQVDDSDGLSEFDFLKETLDDDNESVIVDEYEETLEYDESIFERQSSEAKQKRTVDIGDVLGHLFTDDSNKLSNIILIAPVPLQDDSRNSLALKNQIIGQADVLKVPVFNKEAAGTPCHYMLVFFKTTEAASLWYDSNNGSIILQSDDDSSMRGYLHFTETGNWDCGNCKSVNFFMRTLCHKCYQAKDSGHSPVSVSKESTKWVGISSLKSCFSTTKSVIDSLPSLEDFNIQNVQIISEPRGLPLGLCVFEVQSRAEGTQLHAFFRKHGRASIYVILDEKPETESSIQRKPVGSAIGSEQIADPLATLCTDETPKNIILVAPIPLSKVPKKTKSELSFIEKFLESSLRAEEVKYNNITLHIDKNVGAPCSYGFIFFQSPVAAAHWCSKHDNSLTINTTGLDIPTPEETSFKVFLHFSEGNWNCRNCQTDNFPYRSLCHQCFVHRQENITGPIKKSLSTTRWVATSKLTNWFAGNDLIVADLKNLMKDLKLSKVDVLRDPKCRVFPLGCVFETESWGDSLRLREFLHRTGRFSQFVNTNPCFSEFTCSGSASSDEILPNVITRGDESALATIHNQESTGTPSDKNETDLELDSNKTSLDKNETDDEQDAKKISVGKSETDDKQDSYETHLDKDETHKPSPSATETRNPVSIADVDELMPHESSESYLLWWNHDTTRCSDILNHLFVRSSFTKSSPGQTIFVGPLSAHLACTKKLASTLEKILIDKLEQDNLRFKGISIHGGSFVGGPCTYALVNFETLHDAEVWQDRYKDGLILPKPPPFTKSTQLEKCPSKPVGESEFFKTFVYYCTPNWRCRHCCKSNFGLRSVCFICLNSNEWAPPVMKLSNTPTLCVCIRRFQRWSASEELLYDRQPFLKNRKVSFNVKFLKEESGIPLGVCVLETNNLNDAQLLYADLRLSSGRNVLSYGSFPQPSVVNTMDIGVNEINQIFNDDSPTEILFLGPVPRLTRDTETFYKALISEDGAECIKVECCWAEAFGAPHDYFLIHFNSVDSATDWHRKRQGYMVLKERVLPDGTIKTTDPVNAFLRFSNNNWTCDCGSQNFPARSICFSCYKERNAKSSLICPSSSPTKWLGLRFAKWQANVSSALGMNTKRYKSFEVASVRLYSDSMIPKDNFGILIVETLSITAAERLQKLYKPYPQILSLGFFSFEGLEPGNKPNIGTEVTSQVKLNSKLYVLPQSGSVSAKGKVSILVCPDYETIAWTTLYESRLNKSPSNLVMISLCPGDRELPDEARTQIKTSLQEAGVNCESLLYSFKVDVGSPFSYCLISFDSVDSAETWVNKCGGTFEFSVPSPEDKTLLNFQTCYSQKRSSKEGSTFYSIKSKLHYFSPNWLCSCGKSNFPLRSRCHSCFKNKIEPSDYESVNEATKFVGIKLTEYRDAMNLNCTVDDLRKLGHRITRSALSFDPALPRDPRGVAIFKVNSTEDGTKLYKFLAHNRKDQNYKHLMAMLEQSSGISYLECTKPLGPNWTCCRSENWDNFFYNEIPTSILAFDTDIIGKPSKLRRPLTKLQQNGAKIRKFRQSCGFLPDFWLIQFPNLQAARESYEIMKRKLERPVNSGLHSVHYTADLWVCVNCSTSNFPARVLCHKCYKHKMDGFSPVSLSKKPTRFIGTPTLSGQQQAISSLIKDCREINEKFLVRSIQIFSDPNVKQDGTCLFVFEVSSPVEGGQLYYFLKKRGVQCTFFELFGDRKMATSCGLAVKNCWSVRQPHSSGEVSKQTVKSSELPVSDDFFNLNQKVHDGDVDKITPQAQVDVDSTKDPKPNDAVPMEIECDESIADGEGQGETYLHSSLSEVCAAQESIGSETYDKTVVESLCESGLANDRLEERLDSECWSNNQLETKIHAGEVKDSRPGTESQVHESISEHKALQVIHSQATADPASKVCSTEPCLDMESQNPEDIPAEVWESKGFQENQEPTNDDGSSLEVSPTP